MILYKISQYIDILLSYLKTKKHDRINEASSNF